MIPKKVVQIIDATQTLFLTGTLDKPEPVQVKDELQIFKVADSLAGIRFVNLLTGNKAVNIRLLGDSVSTIVNGLNYKTATGFMPFLVKTTSPIAHAYTFEFSDAASGAVLATYTLNQLDGLLLKNVTVALVGLEDQNTASVILINNYLLDLGT